jgi:hypothetical protein
MITPGGLTPSLDEGVADLHLRSLPEPKRAFLGVLGWNSYGTEGAQPVANVRLFEEPEIA